MFGMVIPVLSEWGKCVVVFVLPIGREREVLGWCMSHKRPRRKSITDRI
jgi:hypothetical protein